MRLIRSLCRSLRARIATAFSVSALAALALPASAGALLLLFPPQFATTNFAAHSEPLSVAVGDFNGDGKQDLVVANRGSDDVSVLLGAGSGSFGTATNFGAHTYPQSVAVGDFNRDGKQDLVVANGDSADVSVLLGTGSGSFSPATNYAAGLGPVSVAVGDFNGDGKQDLAVVNGTSGNVSVLLGTGTGSFGTATNFSAHSGPGSVAVGDFNGDGKQDLAVANVGSGDVSVLLNTTSGGTLSFGSATNFGAHTSPDSVAVGDFNRDGKQDLVVANGDSADVSVLLGTGSTPLFGTATNFGAHTGPHSVAVGDFNGDGRQDLAVANSGSSDASVLLGAGSGSFSPATNFAADSLPQSVAVGDFNGDGKQDLAVANLSDSADDVSVLRNAPRAFRTSAASLAFGSQPRGTVGAPQTVTFENGAYAPLMISEFAISGPNANDFFVSADSCRLALAFVDTCSAQVRFAPEGIGSRTATLTLKSNSVAPDPTVSLAGTGGPLPQGPRGKPGRDAKVTCTVKKGKQNKVKVTCKVKLVKAHRAGLRWRLVHRHHVYAHGVTSARGRHATISLRDLYGLPRGRYVLQIDGRRVAVIAIR